MADTKKGRLNKEETLKVAEDHEKYPVEDRVQDWKLATEDYLWSCASSMKLTSGDILNYVTLQTKKKMGFSRGHMAGRCQILSAFTLWAVLAPRKASASADTSSSRYQTWGVSYIAGNAGYAGNATLPKETLNAYL